MARFFYGFELFRPQFKDRNYIYPLVAANNVVLSAGDACGRSSTALGIYTTSMQVLGVAVRDFTATSTNQTVAKVRPALIPANADYEFLACTNSDMNSLTNVGMVFGVTGATGAQLVDTNAGAVPSTTVAGIVVLEEVDPDKEGGTGEGGGARLGVFRFVRGLNFPY